jgi:hypothetical protein
LIIGIAETIVLNTGEAECRNGDPTFLYYVLYLQVCAFYKTILINLDDDHFNTSEPSLPVAVHQVRLALISETGQDMGLCTASDPLSA